jgi:hypothetical protein
MYETVGACFTQIDVHRFVEFRLEICRVFSGHARRALYGGLTLVPALVVADLQSHQLVREWHNTVAEPST